MNTGIIILSAGNSSRLGSPKQLLPYKNSTLLQQAITAAKKTAYAPIVLVLGAYAEEILAESPEMQVYTIINNKWQEGISTSITTGLSKLLELQPNMDNVIIAVSDQPFISDEIFKALVEKQQQSRKNIVASLYAETIGTPALFKKKYFDELMLLDGNTGAKPILQKYTADVATVPFELGYIDIDTQTDYNNLTQEK
jgi:molybdenum cofactor cytidylyltransferase